MANSLWGKIYYQDTFAGILSEEPGGRCVFAYDDSYLQQAAAFPIALSLPIQAKPHISEGGLHPFFNNLVAEGWLQNAQIRALGGRYSPLKLLLGFGFDLAGAVSVIDPDPTPIIALDHIEQAMAAALLGRASLSGIQRKILVVQQEDKQFCPVRPGELSTHIAKLASGNLSEILALEYLTTEAVRQLLPDDKVVELEMATLKSIGEEALIIKRFDRTPSGSRLHFEEFNQLLEKDSGNSKYMGSYEDMGKFINKSSACLQKIPEIERLFRRVLACLLVGNTDAHFKNFAMFHTKEGLKLTPSYDLVAAAYYKEYQTLALNIAGASDLTIGDLKAKHIIALGLGLGLNQPSIINAVQSLESRLPHALQAISTRHVGSPMLRKKLTVLMEKRWKGSFISIGQLLFKRQNKDVPNSG